MATNVVTRTTPSRASSDPLDLSGFRLERAEAFNWGTFDKHVHWVNLFGKNGLMVGENGAGKTSFGDVFTTLLVRPRHRRYNQASGAEKEERNERSYILGAYEKCWSEASQGEIVHYLRDHSSYSVLLAVFRKGEEETEQVVTIAQVFWFQNRRGDDLRTLYIVANEELHIETHFAIEGEMDTFRRELRMQGYDVYNDVAAYHRRLCSLFGVRSEKAFDLFSQMIASKDIGNINTFLRQHVFEKQDIQRKLEDLYRTFDDLTRSHASLELAERQYKILEPLVREADRYGLIQRELGTVVSCQAIVPLYMARQQSSLLQHALAQLQQALNENRQQEQVYTQELTRLQERQLQLHAQLLNDTINQQLSELTHAAETQKTWLQIKKYEADTYSTYARSVGLQAYQDREVFLQVQREAQTLLEQQEKSWQYSDVERVECLEEKKRLEMLEREYKSEVVSLEQRENQIPSREIALRKQIAQALHLEIEELPYVGELLQIHEGEQRWEAALERFLHAFALQLLVPDRYYRQVSQYVEQARLGMRLVYQHIPTIPVESFPLPQEKETVFGKLEIKPNTPFTSWLQQKVRRSYDYICCESLTQFQALPEKAITLNGQVKRIAGQHEKDDRKPLGLRKDYVLGWNNMEKRQALLQEIAQLEQKLTEQEKQLDSIIARQAQAQQRKQALVQLLQYSDFDRIDWEPHQQKLLRIQEQKRDLETRSDHLLVLQRQLDEVNLQHSNVSGQKREVDRHILALEIQIEQAQTELQKCLQITTGYEDQVQQEQIARLEQDLQLQKVVLTLETIIQAGEALRMQYEGLRIRFQSELAHGEQYILRLMREFKELCPTITVDVDASLEALDAYRTWYTQICLDALPSYRQRFKELLNEKIAEHISIFQASLEQQAEDIRSNLLAFNSVLRGINYTSCTYIELQGVSSSDIQIREFRSALSNSLPNVGVLEPSAEEMERSFNRIKELLERLKRETEWTNKVTDVRYWVEFIAGEMGLEDGELKKSHSDSSGISGGQKARLTATIFAASIAYQYGLNEPDRGRHIRFILMDEAFCRSDKTNTRYILDLFQQLGLQFLVVTPLEKIQVIEPYVQACLYVVNTPELNASRIYNLTMEEYLEQKSRILAGEAL